VKICEDSRARTDDAELVARCQTGDDAAWDELFRRYRGLVFRHGLLIAGDADGAADFVAEIFARLLAALSRFRGEAAFVTYLRSMLIREGRRWRHRNRPVAVRDEAAATAVLSPAARLERFEQHARVRRAVASLPPKLREAVVLRHVHDLSYAGIAQVAHCPIGTVRSRLSEARRLLRERLAESGAEERHEP
jgi:RNA polymerase sigma-70 factor (ECF subfamily)